MIITKALRTEYPLIAMSHTRSSWIFRSTWTMVKLSFDKQAIDLFFEEIRDSSDKRLSFS